MPPLPPPVEIAIGMLQGQRLCAMNSRRLGHGFRYYTQPGNVRIEVDTALYLIRNGIVEPIVPGLLDDTPQAYRLTSKWTD